MVHIINRLNEIFLAHQNLSYLVLMAVSLPLCFAGYRHLKEWVAAFGFFGGLGCGFLIASEGFALGFWESVLMGTLVGVLMLVLSFQIVKAGIFVFGALLTGATVSQLQVLDRVKSIYLPGEFGAMLVSMLPAILTIVIALAAGYVAVKLTRPVIIAVTAAAGAYWAVAGACGLLKVLAITPDNRLWVMIVILLLAVLGIVVQLFTTEKK